MEEKSYGAKILEPLLEKFENMSSEEYNEKHENVIQIKYPQPVQNHKIQLKPYYYECGDHCCSEWGTDIFVDGRQLNNCHSQETEYILQAVLDHFGIDCEVEVLEEEDNSVDYDDYLESVEDDSDEEETEE